MAKKYKLCSRAGVNSDVEIPLDDFTEEEFDEFEKGNLPKNRQDELLTIACESQNFEWWIEEIK